MPVIFNMLNSQHILLASHGTQGSWAAVHASLALLQAHGKIHHFVAVPELWQGMTGDDWLNNGSTRDRFRRYLEGQIGREIDEHCQAVEQLCTNKNIEYEREIRVGKPEQCLIDCCKSGSFDLVIMGSPRPKGVSGLRSRMKLEPLAKTLATPLLIIPFPQA